MTLNRIIQTGTYTGTGAPQSIAIGWLPAVVMIFSTSATNANRGCALKIDTMPGDDFVNAIVTGGFITTNGITLTASGFDVGSEVTINENGTVHHWIAFRTGAQVDTGTYTFQAPNPQVTGRQPDLVLVGNNGGDLFIKNSQMVAQRVWRSDTPFFTTNEATLDANGWTPSNDMNQNGVTYFWAAFYLTQDSTRHLESAGYAGDANATVTVQTGAPLRFLFDVDNFPGGFQPIGGFKTDTMAGGDYYQFIMGTSTAFIATGPTLNASDFDSGVDFNVNTRPYIWSGVFN